MEIAAGTFVTLFAVIGLIALIVSTITEVTKGIVILSKIPVNLRIIVLSLTLTIVTYFAYISYSGKPVKWYCVIASVVTGFVVAYVVLFGWDKFAYLYKRFRNIPPIDITTDSTTDIATDKSATNNDIKVDLSNEATVKNSSSKAATSASDPSTDGTSTSTK